MSKMNTFMTVGVLLLAAFCAGCQGRAGADLQRTKTANESNGPADGNWKRWLAAAPAGQPQPRFVCERPIENIGPVWAGVTTTFGWEVANAGKAPLRIELWA